MRKLRYRFIQSANVDLNLIWEAVARESPDAADRIVAAIYERVTLLAQFAHIGHVRADLVGDRPVLFSTVKRYLVVYEIRADLLTVLAVLHSARDIPVILRHRKAAP